MNSFTPNRDDSPRIALVHDWLNQRGGAEDVLEVLHERYPDSPIYTSLYAPDLMPEAYLRWPIRTLWSDRLPGIHRHHQAYLPAYWLAWGGLRVRDADIILSNKSGFCHGLRYEAGAMHVCYCLAPTRYVWQFDEYIAREGIGRAVETALRPAIAALRAWDYAAAARVHRFIAISTEIRDRIRRYYDRDSTVIFPPVDTARFQPSDQVDDYYLIVSRLIPYKRIDLAVQAATRLGVPLKIGGRGRDLDRLRAMAGSNVEFLGYVADDALPGLMSRAKAFLFPGLEDFGITPVQAQAAGRPVIAFGGGGALDTVIPAVTGEHFSNLSVDSLAEVWSRFDADAYDPAAMRSHAARFDTSVFLSALDDYIASAWAAFGRGEQFK